MGEYSKESVEDSIPEVKSSGAQDATVEKNTENEDGLEFTDITIIKKKELSIFKIISRRYNLHFSTQ